jgi:1-acyl-sn-glycerol-3-phosphate acyltransferase
MKTTMLMKIENPPSRFRLYVGSAAYWLILCISTFVFANSILLSFWLPFRFRYALAKMWSHTNLAALKYLCGLNYVIEGLENVPADPVIIFAKHQSAYEIIILLGRFKPMTWVAKHEILYLPIFGWAFVLTKPVMIKRNTGGRAVDQLVRQGSKSLCEGRSVVIFPEGTRTMPGAAPNYRIGGAILAEKSAYPVLPVAHNAGEYWPRNSFLKYPGTVKLCIGPIVRSTDKTAEQINTEAQRWIESKVSEISDPTRWQK